MGGTRCGACWLSPWRVERAGDVVRLAANADFHGPPFELVEAVADGWLVVWSLESSAPGAALWPMIATADSILLLADVEGDVEA